MQKKLTRILNELDAIAYRLEYNGRQDLAEPINNALNEIEKLRDLCKALN